MFEIRVFTENLDGHAISSPLAIISNWKPKYSTDKPGFGFDSMWSGPHHNGTSARDESELIPSFNRIRDNKMAELERTIERAQAEHRMWRQLTYADALDIRAVQDTEYADYESKSYGGPGEEVRKLLLARTIIDPPEEEEEDDES